PGVDQSKEPFDARHACSFQLCHRIEILVSQDGKIIAPDGSGWRRAENDRIVSMMDCFNLDNSFRASSMSIIPGPFPERPFRHHPLVGRGNEAFDGDFAKGGNGETGELSANDRIATLMQITGDFEFRDAFRRVEKS